ncbi:MAG: nucleoside diphosphate kinase regulator [Planctomycetales bacterium]|nr:nucleoside diphosphate kinase regulator [Planctomycetales bacterium]
MAAKKIIITKDDHRRLAHLLISNFSETIGDKRYLRDLRGELEQAKVVESHKLPPDVVTMNSTVRIRDLESDELETYTLVYPNDANFAEGRLSILAPIGTAILGYRVGDVVDWQVPSGAIQMRIEEIVCQPKCESLTDVA